VFDKLVTISIAQMTTDKQAIRGLLDNGNASRVDQNALDGVFIGSVEIVSSRPCVLHGKLMGTCAMLVVLYIMYEQFCR
jgi:hypothetical protein